MKKLLLAILFCAAPVLAQVPSNIPNTNTSTGSATPGGACLFNQFYVDTASSGTLYFCDLGTWTAVSGSGGGLSGMTAGQVPIAATASTVTSSKALAGSGAGITTGPASGVTSGDLASLTGTGGQIADSSVVAANVVTASSPGAGLCHFAGSTQACTSSAVVGSDMTNNTVTATQLAAQYSKGSCTEVWGGSGTSFALTSGDDAIANNSCYNDSGVTRTITKVACRSDNSSNTTTVNPTFGSAGTGTTILMSALTCGNSYAYASSTSFGTGGTVWATGNGITPAMSGTLTGTSIAMIVEYTF